MKPATARARELLFKLESLAARPGTPAEGKAAARKIARLKRHYDFDAKAPCAQKDVKDIFAGSFRPASIASHIYKFEPDDYAIANSVKWAIESAARVECIFRDGELLAKAAPSSANRLASIAVTISESYRELWRKFSGVAGVNAADRSVFIMGLYDGMMNEVKPALLPSRAEKPMKLKAAKKRALAPAPGVAVHPYTVAVNCGKQVRFSTPWNIIANEIDNLTPKEIEA